MHVQLFINSIPVVLPQDFEIAYQLNNPELVEREESKTYPFTVSSHANKNIFGFIDRNRIDASKEYFAELYVSSFKMASGRAVITSIDEDHIELYITSENRRFWEKYNNVFINELDLGFEYFSIEPRYMEEELSAAISGDRNYLVSPLSRRVSVGETNEWSNYNIWDFDEQKFTPSSLIIFPRLSYIITQIFIALGYTITRDDIKKNNYLKDIIILASKTAAKLRNVYYKDLLAHVSVVDFLRDIEKKFNISFLVNNRNKTVTIKTSLDTSTPLNKELTVYDSSIKEFVDPILYKFSDGNINDTFLDEIKDSLKFPASNQENDNTKDVTCISSTAAATSITETVYLNGHEANNTFKIEFERLIIASDNKENTEIRYAEYKGLLNKACDGEIDSGFGTIPISLPIVWTGTKGLFNRYHKSKVELLSSMRIERSVFLKPRLSYLNNLFDLFSNVLIISSQKHIAKSQEILISQDGIIEHSIKCYPI